MSSDRINVRTNPAIIRAALMDAEQTSANAAAQRVGVSHTAVRKWQRKAAEYGDWPTDQDIADWRANEVERAAQRARDRDWGKRRIITGRPQSLSAVGTRRRLRALYALGHTWDAIAEAMGRDKTSASNLAHGRQGTRPRNVVYASTAQVVAEVYDRLSMTRPDGWVAARARNTARKYGWAPPLAWDEGTIDDPNARPVGMVRDDTHVDEAVVLRILDGDNRVHANAAERVEVCRRWVAAGRSLKALERLTGWRPDRYYKIEEGAA